jgi:hypothetical protein
MQPDEYATPRPQLLLVVEGGCKREQREDEDKDIDDPLAIYRQRNGGDVAWRVGQHQEGRGRGRSRDRQREVEPSDPQPGQDEDHPEQRNADPEHHHSRVDDAPQH